MEETAADGQLWPPVSRGRHASVLSAEKRGQAMFAALPWSGRTSMGLQTPVSGAPQELVTTWVTLTVYKPFKKTVWSCQPQW